MAQKILIIQTAFIGDALLSIPLLKKLRQSNFDAEITYLCRSGLGDLLGRLHLVDHVLEVNKEKTKNFSGMKSQLKAKKWDWIICPHESPRSQFLCHSLSAPRKTSYKGLLRGLSFNECIERPMDLPEALRSLALLQNSYPEIKLQFDNFRNDKDSIEEFEYEFSADLRDELGLKQKTYKNICRVFRKIPKDLSMEIEYLSQLRQKKLSHLPVEVSENVRAILNQTEGKKVYLIAPGSVWETKMWRADYFRKVIESLTSKNFVVLIGGKPERELCKTLSEGLSNVHNAAGETSLWESAQLLACADQVLTNDSGAMHLASLSSAKVLSIFGPTVLEQGYRPWSNQASTIESSLYCRPCGKHGAKKCPLSHHGCMKLISSEQVLKLI